MTRKKAYQLIEKYCVPESIRIHCEKVAWVARRIAEKLKEKGIKIDPERMFQAGLLHDLFRICDIEPFDAEKLLRNVEKRELKTYQEKIQREVWENLRKKYKGMTHEIATASFLRGLKEEKLAQIIEQHGLVQIFKGFDGWEEKVLYYADKRVAHTKITSLKERLKEARARCMKRNGSKKELEQGDKARKKIPELEKEIFEIIGESPEIINEKSYARDEKKLTAYETETL